MPKIEIVGDWIPFNNIHLFINFIVFPYIA